jgi:hypothetical protein
MKKYLFFPALILISFYGCNGNGNKTNDKQSSPQMVVKKENISLLTGDKDEFNPKSRIESIRKVHLTNFGIRNTPSPVKTPDETKALEQLEGASFSKLNLKYYNSMQLTFPSYPFDYENDINALKNLYKIHKLNTVVKKEMSELEMLSALMIYTNKFMEGGKTPENENDIGPSAEVITKSRLEKGIGGTSRHYAALFCQLALSCGFNARLVSMHTVDEKGDILANDVCEVYLNSFDKWAVFDVYSKATYYTRDNIPQSALELREIMLDQNFKALNVNTGLGDLTDVVSLREKTLNRYKYIYIWRMNDILSKSPKGGSIPWEKLYESHLVWEDEKAPISNGKFDKVDKFSGLKQKGVRFVTHNRDDFNWSLNHVCINITRKSDNSIYVYLDTITPNFDSYEINDSGIKIIKDDLYKTIIPIGKKMFTSKNLFGVYGIISDFYITPE